METTGEYKLTTVDENYTSDWDYTADDSNQCSDLNVSPSWSTRKSVSKLMLHKVRVSQIEAVTLPREVSVLWGDTAGVASMTGRSLETSHASGSQKHHCGSRRKPHMHVTIVGGRIKRGTSRAHCGRHVQHTASTGTAPTPKQDTHNADHNKKRLEVQKYLLAT